MRFILNRPWLGIIVALVLSIVGAWQGMGIPIRLSLMHLLPEDRPSVKESKEVATEIGGIGYLLAIVGPTEQPQAQMPAIEAALKGHPEIRYTFYEREKYLVKNKALYVLPSEDFESFIVNTETLLYGGKVGGLLDLGLDDEGNEDRVKEARAELERIRQKHLPADEADGKATTDGVPERDRFYLSKDGKYAAFWIKPDFDSEDLKRSEAFVDGVYDRLNASLPSGTPYKLWGRYVNHVRDVKQIKKDIGLTTGTSSLLIALILVLGLGSLRSSIATMVCVFLSMGWTIGFANLVIGQINIITGFLLAILGGLGVEYGIHLIRRYHQEREAGLDRDKAFEQTYFTVGRALWSAALTSAGAFLILAWSDFRAFSELGIIAGFGILAIFASYMLCFPAFRYILPPKQRFKKGVEMFGYFPFRKSWIWALIPLAGVVIYGLTQARFEYDFTKMRELSKDVQALNGVMNDIMNNRTTTPIAVLAKDREQAGEVQAWLADPERAEVIHSALSLENIFPSDMADRAERLSKFAKRIDEVDDAKIRKETGLDPTLVKGWFKQGPYPIEEIPPHMRQAFGKSGNIVLVYSRASLSKFEGIQAITSTLEAAAREYPGLKIGGDTRIFKEILDHVFYDGRIVLIMFLIGAFFVLWFDFRSIKDSLGLEAQLVLGILFLVGLMGAIGIPFSIVNIGMLPAVLACGIDIGVHVRHRELEGHGTSIESAKFVAQAVQLAVVTTLVGFGSLFLADAAMLKGIAWISVLGQGSMYLICMWVWPVCKDVFRARRKGAAAAGSK